MGKFVLGGRFKESELFSEKKKIIGVLYLKSCQSLIFSHTGERESDQINGNSPKYQHEYVENDFQIEKKTFSPIFAAPVKLTLLWKSCAIFCDFLRPILAL